MKPAILDAALALVERSGMTALTIEEVAREAGVTKGGVLYHFPTKDRLIAAMADHVVARWERALLDLLGKPFAQASAADRVAAYVALATCEASRAPLALFVESVEHDDLMTSWRALQTRWLGETESDAAALDRIVAQLAADGLWLARATDCAPFEPEVEARIISRIRQLAETQPVRDPI
ncbi:MAG: TetR family transcriptional regulator [Thermomicrobiales bacterium]|nr:TetR family transcriptional regulator [Thermomicrobiales bacterium]